MDICKEMAQWTCRVFGGVDGQHIPEDYLLPRLRRDYGALEASCREIGMDCSDLVFYCREQGDRPRPMQSLGRRLAPCLCTACALPVPCLPAWIRGVRAHNSAHPGRRSVRSSFRDCSACLSRQFLFGPSLHPPPLAATPLAPCTLTSSPFVCDLHYDAVTTTPAALLSPHRPPP